MRTRSERPSFAKSVMGAATSLQHRTLLLLLLQLIIIKGINAQEANLACMSESNVCGSNSTCMNGFCTCNSFFFSTSGSNTDCKSITEGDPLCSVEECVFCGRNHEGPCRRCTNFLQGSKCVDECPGGHNISLISEISLTSKVCSDAETSFSLPEWAIILIVAVVIGIIFGIIITVLVLVVWALHRSSHGVLEIEGPHRSVENSESHNGTMRTKRSNSFSFERNSKDAERTLVQENYLYTDLDSDEEEEIDGDDETIFMHKLDKLRGRAEDFLHLLNDMRKRSKELPADSLKAEQYKAVINDVTRLLYLLNKTRSKVKMPVDGVELMRWSEKILKRYLASQGKTLKQNEVQSYVRVSIKDKEAFLKKLDNLRDHSEHYLRMLNELRRRLKDTQPDNPIAQKYRAITKDLTRLLELLNKRPSTVEVTAERMELVKNTELLLEGYLASQRVTLKDQKAHELSKYGVQDETDF